MKRSYLCLKQTNSTMDRISILIVVVIFLGSCSSGSSNSNNRQPIEQKESIKKINSYNSQNIFDVVLEISKSGPETLDGTNNETWFTYYKDIDITFVVMKSNGQIQQAYKGRVSKNDLY